MEEPITCTADGRTRRVGNIAPALLGNCDPAFTVDRIERISQARIARSSRLEEHGRPVGLGQQINEDDARLGVAAAVAAPAPAGSGNGGVH